MAPKRPAEEDEDSSDHKQKVARPRKKASSSAVQAVASEVTLVTKLEENDVLMGRGALATDFEGNLRLREIVRHRQDEYVRAAKRNRKHRIAEEIIDVVRARGGRFLQGAETLKGIDPSKLPRFEAAWFVVEDMDVLTAKVKQLLRDVKPRVGGPAPASQQYDPSNQFGAATSLANATQNPSPNYSAAQPMATTSQPKPTVAPWPAHASQVPVQIAPRAQAAPQWQAQGAPQGHFSFPPLSSISMSTSQRGQENASTALGASTTTTTTTNTPRDQQYNALWALTLSSRLIPGNGNHGNPAPAQSAPTPAAESSERMPGSLASLAAILAEQNQRRQREHEVTQAILSQILPQLREGHQPPAAAPTPSPMQAPASPDDPPCPLSRILEHLRARESTSSSSDSGGGSGQNMGAPIAAPASSGNVTAPAPPPPSLSDLTSFLRREATQPRPSGTLETPAAIREMERLIFSGSEQQSSTRSAPPPPAPAPPREESGRPEESLIHRILRSLQTQYPPSHG